MTPGSEWALVSSDSSTTLSCPTGALADQTLRRTDVPFQNRNKLSGHSTEKVNAFYERRDGAEDHLSRL